MGNTLYKASLAGHLVMEGMGLYLLNYDAKEAWPALVKPEANLALLLRYWTFAIMTQCMPSFPSFFPLYYIFLSLHFIVVFFSFLLSLSLYHFSLLPLFLVVA